MAELVVADGQATLTFSGEVREFAYCAYCDTAHEVDDALAAGQLYECGECGQAFNRGNSADGDSHRCPSCNRFGSRYDDGEPKMSCPDCTGEPVELKDMIVCDECDKPVDEDAWESHVKNGCQ